MKFVKTVHGCPICKQKYKTFQDAYKCHLKCLQNKKLEGESQKPRIIDDYPFTNLKPTYEKGESK